MRVPFSQFPGRHERHYRRKLDNPLYLAAQITLDDDELLEVQRLDHDEIIDFVAELRGFVQQAIDLKPNVESDVILALKENLDRMFEVSAGLGDEQQGNQEAILQLLGLVMKSVIQAAEGDPTAMQELDDETQARTAHFTLLKQPLIADILHPKSAIKESELAATLISESEEAVASAVQLFDLEQTSQLYDDAQALLQKGLIDQSHSPQPWMRLTQIEAWLIQLREDATLN